ncbi:hypothetical protein DBR06_SOUSAS8210081, partial [Sousa chinensis]
MSSPADSGHSNWTLTQTGDYNCRCRPLGTDRGRGVDPAAHDKDPRHPAARSWGGRLQPCRR